MDQRNIATEWVGEGKDNNTIVRCVGTSPAAAYASGVLALYLEKFRQDLSTAGRFTYIGPGRLIDSVLNRCPNDTSDAGVARLVYDGTRPYP